MTCDYPNQIVTIPSVHRHNFKSPSEQSNSSEFSHSFDQKIFLKPTSTSLKFIFVLFLLLTLNLQIVHSIPALKAYNIPQFQQNNPVELGKQCQSSGQCRVKDPNSGCYALKDFYDWRCLCTVGFVEKDGKCEASPEYLKNPYERCASLDQVYVLVLDRCVNRSQMPYYAHRGGGGRGGKGGGGKGGGLGDIDWTKLGNWLFSRRSGGIFGHSFWKRNAANFACSNLLHISALSLISCYLTNLISTKNL